MNLQSYNNYVYLQDYYSDNVNIHIYKLINVSTFTLKCVKLTNFSTIHTLM